MSKLFSEIYGCYYGIISRILRRAEKGISQSDMDDIVEKFGFSETAFHLLPKIMDDEWVFLEKHGELYYSKFSKQFNRPATKLELSWLASILSDGRIKLFFSKERLAELTAALADVTPLFDAKDIVAVDQHRDGDPYDDPNYIANFRQILGAVKNRYPIVVTYDSEKTGRVQRTCQPYKLSYSELNDKFRLLCATFSRKAKKPFKTTLNLAKIISVRRAQSPDLATPEELSELFTGSCNNPPIVVEITKERNTLERFLLQFASFDRKTEYDSDRDIYISQIFYDTADETELLIRILSFGPTVKVLSPQNFLTQIKKRLTAQLAHHASLSDQS